MNSSRRQFLARTAVGAAVVAGGSIAATPATASSATAVAGTRGTRITALTGACVIDVATGHRRKHQTILISGERIIAVGRDLPVPHGATRIELAGKYVIPGLADMHVHSDGSDRISVPLYLANGLTTVREMSANPAAYDQRARIEAGTLLGPRMVVGSRIIDGDPTLWDTNVLDVHVVDDDATARAAVRREKADGADFIKVYSRLNPTAYKAIVDEARRQGLTVHGHGPDQLTIKQVSAAGQRSIEHIHAIALAVSKRESDVRRMLQAIELKPADYNGWFRKLHPIEWLAANTYSRARAADVFGTLRRNRTRVTPTLTMHHALDMPDLVQLDPALKPYLSAGAAWGFDYAIETLYKPNRTPEEISRQRYMWAYRKWFVGELFAHGVPVLAGTDTGTPYSLPGFSLHHELELLVEAGATTQQALYSATVEPARFLGRQADLGSVGAGRIADLVVLDADPLADIHNTRRIDSVISRGRVISAATRRRMLADVEAAVKEPTPAAAMAAGGCCGTRRPGH